MRVCLVTSAPMPPREGLGFYVWHLARFLKESGHGIQIITRGSHQKSYRQRLNGINIWRTTFLPLYPFHVHLNSIFVDRLLREMGPQTDLIHLHTPLVRRPSTRLPVIVTIHTSMRADVASLQLNNPLSLLAKLQAPFSYRLEQGLLGSADRLAAVALSVAGELADYGIDPGQVAVLGNGVDTQLFSPDGLVGSTYGRYSLTVGRLGPRKGLEDLVDCAQILADRFPDLRFLVAGSGPLEGRLRSVVRKRGLQGRVKLLGHVGDRQKLANLYRGAAVYIHPAHYEGLPTVLLEAMACGRSVVATAVCGALDLIEDGRNGLLVAARAPQEMAAAVARLLVNPAFSQQLSQAARQTIEELYSWEVVGGHYLAEYQQLLDRKQS